MTLENIFKTYFRLKGVVDRKNYLIGISLSIILSTLYEVLSMRHSIINIINQKLQEESQSPRGSGILNLLNSFDNDINPVGIQLLFTYSVLYFIASYATVVVTIKYCRKLGFSAKVGYILGGITFLAFWLQKSVIIYLFVYDIDPTLVAGTLLVLTGLSGIIYLYRYELGKTDSGKTEKSVAKIIIILLIFYILQLGISVLNKHNENRLWYLQIITLLAVVCVYFYLIVPEVSKVYKGFNKIWLLLAAFVCLEILYVLAASTGTILKIEGLLIYVNTFMELIEAVMMVAIMIPLMFVGIDKEQTEESVEIKLTEPDNNGDNNGDNNEN